MSLLSRSLHVYRCCRHLHHREVRRGRLRSAFEDRRASVVHLAADGHAARRARPDARSAAAQCDDGGVDIVGQRVQQLHAGALSVDLDVISLGPAHLSASDPEGEVGSRHLLVLEARQYSAKQTVGPRCANTAY